MPATDNGLRCYYPEMGESKPETQIDARLGHYGKHWFVTSKNELSGRGVKLLEIYRSEDLTPQAQHKVGWFRYKVTQLAFDRICEHHPVSTEILL